ncbi:MAG: hypothetical protein ACKVQA_26145 [Burkholderiales bacterium]
MISMRLLMFALPYFFWCCRCTFEVSLKLQANDLRHWHCRVQGSHELRHDASFTGHNNPQRAVLHFDPAHAGQWLQLYSAEFLLNANVFVQHDAFRVAATALGLIATLPLSPATPTPTATLIDFRAELAQLQEVLGRWFSAGCPDASQLIAIRSLCSNVQKHVAQFCDLLTEQGSFACWDGVAAYPTGSMSQGDDVCACVMGTLLSFCICGACLRFAPLCVCVCVCLGIAYSIVHRVACVASHCARA